MNRSRQATIQRFLSPLMVMALMAGAPLPAQGQPPGASKPIYGYSATLELTPAPSWSEGAPGERGLGYNVVTDFNDSRWLGAHIVVYAMDGNPVERFPVQVRITSEGLTAGVVSRETYSFTYWKVNGARLENLLGTFRGGEAGLGLFFSFGGMAARNRVGVCLLGTKHGEGALQLDVSHLIIEVAPVAGPGVPAGTWKRVLRFAE